MMIQYTALSFVRLENGGLAPGEASAVMRRANAMVRNEANAAAVALAHVDSPDFGNFEDPLILKTFGDVPEDFDCSR